MVKQRRKNSKKRPNGKGFKTNSADAGLSNANLLNITAAYISPSVGVPRAALSSCASPMKRLKNQGKLLSAHCLKMIAIFTACEI